ncbi:MAG TPA: type II secretion system protein [Geminicoccaceae bacterium]|nr:type II secretion system protein [Geminicoccaceae bacterium]
MWSSLGLPGGCGLKTRPRAAARSSRGFTLLEMLVALIVLTFLGGALLQSFSLGLRSVEVTGQHETVLAYARSYLDRIGNDLPLREGELAGDLENGLQWRASIQAYALPAAQPRNQPTVRAYMVEVAVSGDETGPVLLKTLRLASEHSGGLRR